MKNEYKWKKCIRGSNDWWPIKNHGWKCESLIFRKRRWNIILVILEHLIWRKLKQKNWKKRGNIKMKNLTTILNIINIINKV